MEVLDKIQCIFTTYPFLKECILIFLSVISGGVITVYINTGAMRKQSKYEMQHTIINSIFEDYNHLAKRLEEFEISYPFNKLNEDDYKNYISSIASEMLQLNEKMREKRKFIRKYLKATTVEKSAIFVLKFQKTFYSFDGGLANMTIKSTIGTSDLKDLRLLIQDIKSINNEITEILESFISPSLLSKLSRKIRPIQLFIDELISIIRVNKTKK